MAQDNSAPLLPDWTWRQIVAGTVVILAVGFGFWLLYHFSLVVFMLFIGMVIGTAVRPLVTWLQDRGVPGLVGTILIYAVFLILVIGFVLLLVPLIANQISTLGELLPDYYQTLREIMLSSSSRLGWRLGLQLPQELPSLEFLSRQAVAADTATEDGADQETISAVTQALEYAGLVGWGAFIFTATLLLSFFWTIEGPRAIRTLLLLIPRDRREGARSLVEASEAKVGAYIRGQTILCVAIGILSLIAYLLIGLPYALVLALIAGILEAVPYLGPTLGAVPAVLLTLSSEPEKVLWVIAAVLIIQLLENNLLVPRIMDESVGVNPIVTLLSIAAFGSLLGVAGAILAIPIAAIVQLLLDRFLLDPQANDPKIPVGRDTLSVLRYETQRLVQDLRQQIRGKDQELVVDEPVDQVEENIEAIATALDSVLAEATKPQEAQ